MSTEYVQWMSLREKLMMDLKILNQLFRSDTYHDLIAAKTALQQLFVSKSECDSALGCNVHGHRKLLHVPSWSPERQKQLSFLISEISKYCKYVLCQHSRALPMTCTYLTRPAVWPDDTALSYCRLACSFSFTSLTYILPSISLKKQTQNISRGTSWFWACQKKIVRVIYTYL